jgi:ATP-dependent protease HslVU (ClpYQ) peptidase subunit
MASIASILGFAGGTRRKKSIKAQINKQLKIAEKKKLRAALEALKKRNRGY